MVIRMVGGWMFLLVPAYPGSPGQRAVKQLLLLAINCSRLYMLNNNYWQWPVLYWMGRETLTQSVNEWAWNVLDERGMCWMSVECVEWAWNVLDEHGMCRMSVECVEWVWNVLDEHGMCLMSRHRVQRSEAGQCSSWCRGSCQTDGLWHVQGNKLVSVVCLCLMRPSPCLSYVCHNMSLSLSQNIMDVPPPQPFYGSFSGTTRVSRCRKRTSGLYGARGD